MGAPRRKTSKAAAGGAAPRGCAHLAGAGSGPVDGMGEPSRTLVLHTHSARDSPLDATVTQLSQPYSGDNSVPLTPSTGPGRTRCQAVPHPSATSASLIPYSKFFFLQTNPQHIFRLWLECQRD